MWIVCITSVRHVLTVNGYGGRQTKENEKSWCFKGWETLVSVSYYPEEIGITFYPKVSKYFIYSYTYIDGDLELTCTNCDNINYSLDCSFGIVKNNVGKDISATEEEVGVSVKNTDNKTLRIHFAKLKDEDFPSGFLIAQATIKVYGRVGGKDVTTNISVYRSRFRKQSDDDISKK